MYCCSGAGFSLCWCRSRDLSVNLESLQTVYAYGNNLEKVLRAKAASLAP